MKYGYVVFISIVLILLSLTISTIRYNLNLADCKRYAESIGISKYEYAGETCHIYP